MALVCCANIFASTEEVTVSLPSWPPENAAKHLYPDLVRWDIIYFDGSKCVPLSVPPDTKKISFKAQKNDQLPLVAQPVTRHGGNSLSFFYPAGTLYPFYTEATWQDGWAATVAMQTAQTGNMETIKKFNWQKLVEKVREKTTESDRDKVKVPVNPWYFDTEKCITAIKSQNFPPSNFNNPSKRYFFSANLIVKNYQYFKENKENGKYLESPKDGQFYSKEENTLRMFLEESEIILQNQPDLENQIPLCQYIFEQDSMNSTGETFLRAGDSVYFLIGNMEVVSVKRSKTTKTLKMKAGTDEFAVIFGAKK